VRRTVSVAIAGTAKNAGKTTTAVRLAAAAREQGLTVGFTSIGLDGERRDFHTGLDKPPIILEPGSWVVTAAPCLEAAGPAADRIRPMGMRTALGRLVLARLARRAPVVVAGPPHGDELAAVIETLDDSGCDLVLVDGAVNRIRPLTRADVLVTATGAVRRRDPAALARETAQYAAVLTLPPAGRPHEVDPGDCRGGSGEAVADNLLLPGRARDLGRELAKAHRPARRVRVSGALSLAALEALLDVLWGAWTGEGGTAAALTVRPGLVFSDPGQLLSAGPIGDVADVLSRVRGSGWTVGVVRPVHLVGITVNPFYPERLPGGRHAARRLPARPLLAAVREAVPVPAFDVVAGGAGGLLACCLSAAETHGAGRHGAPGRGTK